MSIQAIDQERNLTVNTESSQSLVSRKPSLKLKQTRKISFDEDKENKAP